MTFTMLGGITVFDQYTYSPVKGRKLRGQSDFEGQPKKKTRIGSFGIFAK